MNKYNYASHEASKELINAGIRIDTEIYWKFIDGEWVLRYGHKGISQELSIPAPSMAEAWRELPIEATDNNIKYRKMVTVGYLPSETIVGYYNCMETIVWLVSYHNYNSIDALCKLLIWTKRNNYKR